MKHVMMSRLAPLPLSLVLAACAAASQDAADAGGDSATSSPYEQPPAAAGIGCKLDPSTGVKLCKGISTCPGLEVDEVDYPDCGFHVNTGNTLDIECSCHGYLCSVGVATTCSQAKALLAAQDAFTVCLQVGEGICTLVDSSSAPEAGSSCNQDCYASCVSDPVCIKACGC